MNRRNHRKSNRAYYLRDIPSDLWKEVIAKAKTDGRNVRWVILHALRDWLDGTYEPTRGRLPK